MQCGGFYGYYGGLNTVGDLASYGQYADDSTFPIGSYVAK